MDDELKQAFDLFDRNGDGTVSKAELVFPFFTNTFYSIQISFNVFYLIM